MYVLEYDTSIIICSLDLLLRTNVLLSRVYLVYMILLCVWYSPKFHPPRPPSPKKQLSARGCHQRLRSPVVCELLETDGAESEMDIDIKLRRVSRGLLAPLRVARRQRGYSTISIRGKPVKTKLSARGRHERL